jgi:hypothetical protein
MQREGRRMMARKEGARMGARKDAFTTRAWVGKEFRETPVLYPSGFLTSPGTVAERHINNYT